MIIPSGINFLYSGPCELFIALYLMCWVFEIPMSASMSNHCQLNIYLNCSCFCFALLLALRRCGACTSESQCYLHLEVSRKGVKMKVTLRMWAVKDRALYQKQYLCIDRPDMIWLFVDHSQDAGPLLEIFLGRRRAYILPKKWTWSPWMKNISLSEKISWINVAS